MNRQQRRATKKPAPLTMEQRVNALYKNGITLEDLQKTEKRAYERGVNYGCEFSMKTFYASLLQAANKLYGFGKDRGLRLLQETDRIITYTLTTEDAINEVYSKFGITLNFKEAFPEDRVYNAQD